MSDLNRLPSPSLPPASARSSNVSEAFPWNLIFICLLILCATYDTRSVKTLLCALVILACMVGSNAAGFR